MINCCGFLAIILIFTLNSGCSTELSDEEEEELLDQFRPLVLHLLRKDHMKSDGYLLRWLRAYDLDLDQTVEALTKSLEWRAANDIDSILNEDFSLIEKEFWTLIDGSVDNDGRPLLYATVGLFDLRKIVLAGGGQVHRFKRLLTRNFELMENYIYQIGGGRGQRTDNVNGGNAKESTKLPQGFAIFDLSGLSVKQAACYACLTASIEVLTTFDSHYPGLSYRSYAINTPKIFFQPFNAAKPLLSVATLNSAKIFDFDKAKWSKSLLEEIPADQLLAQYGGTKHLRGNDSSRNTDKQIWNSFTNEIRRKVVLGKVIELGEDQTGSGSPVPAPPVDGNQSILRHQPHHHHYSNTPGAAAGAGLAGPGKARQANPAIASSPSASSQHTSSSGTTGNCIADMKILSLVLSVLIFQLKLFVNY